MIPNSARGLGKPYITPMALRVAPRTSGQHSHRSVRAARKAHAPQLPYIIRLATSCADNGHQARNFGGGDRGEIGVLHFPKAKEAKSKRRSSAPTHRGR